ncbi:MULTISPECIES: hypothetical protein [unclassified Streptomyces]|uniref:hypothetical protein n=1 Tax=unclassified Streptomyces TaxID=2593676 RepID=UPI0005BBF3C4|nr:hypothetical protein [Streptomyces sp. NRRL F-5193]
MKTCDRFNRIKAGFENDLAILNSHAAQHEGSNPAKASSRIAKGVKLNMGRMLARHYSRCRLCC